LNFRWLGVSHENWGGYNPPWGGLDKSLFEPLSASARDAPAKAGGGTVDVPPSRVDLGWIQHPLWPNCIAQRLAKPWQSVDVPPIRIQDWGISHARPWEASSELIVHSLYVHNAEYRGRSIFTRDTVARDLASHLVPNVRPSVLPQATETLGVRPTARLADRPGSVMPRSRSGSPDRAVRSPRLRRPPDIAIPGHPVYTVRTQSPPPAPPPSPIPMMSQYLDSDDESQSSDATLPPA